MAGWSHLFSRDKSGTGHITRRVEAPFKDHHAFYPDLENRLLDHPKTGIDVELGVYRLTGWAMQYVRHFLTDVTRGAYTSIEDVVTVGLLFDSEPPTR